MGDVAGSAALDGVAGRAPSGDKATPMLVGAAGRLVAG